MASAATGPEQTSSTATLALPDAVRGKKRVDECHGSERRSWTAMIASQTFCFEERGWPSSNEGERAGNDVTMLLVLRLYLAQNGRWANGIAGSAARPPVGRGV